MPFPIEFIFKFFEITGVIAEITYDSFFPSAIGMENKSLFAIISVNIVIVISPSGAITKNIFRIVYMVEWFVYTAIKSTEYS